MSAGLIAWLYAGVAVTSLPAAVVVLWRSLRTSGSDSRVPAVLAAIAETDAVFAHRLGALDEDERGRLERRCAAALGREASDG